MRANGDKKEALTVADWAPAVDITEDDKEYLVKAELPEVRKDDVRVTVENGKLKRKKRIRNIIASNAPMGVSTAASLCPKGPMAQRSPLNSKRAC